MSASNCMDLAKRVCESSKQICEFLDSRIQVDTQTLTICDTLRSPTSADPVFPHSMTVSEQTAHFGLLDAISTKIDAWARLSQGTKSNSKLKRKQMSKSEPNRSKENVSTDVDQPSEDTTNNIALPEKPLANLSPDEIRVFNDRHFGCKTDISKMCEKDKQSLRPIFKHVPKLKEFIGQLESAVGVKVGNSVEADPKITILLERLYEVIVDVTYLEDNENIYGRNDIEPYDDLVQTCLEQLYKQIMNQEI